MTDGEVRHLLQIFVFSLALITAMGIEIGLGNNNCFSKPAMHLLIICLPVNVGTAMSNGRLSLANLRREEISAESSFFWIRVFGVFGTLAVVTNLVLRGYMVVIRR